MRYLLPMLFAAMLVVAQSCWKHAVGLAGSPFKDETSVYAVVRFVLSPWVIAGALLYVAGIGLYMHLLAKYEFSFVQALVIPLSLIFSIVIAVSFFGEQLSVLNYIGLVVIVAGIVLLTLR
jgi:uncharacterized membrane protein